MIRPSAEAAAQAMELLKTKGLPSDKAETLRSLVNDKVKAAHDPIVNQAGGEFEETWECVKPEDPNILAAAEEFVAAEGLAEEADLVTAIHDFVKKQSIFHVTLGFYQSPSMDFDD